jgi:hypothetical protein
MPIIGSFGAGSGRGFGQQGGKDTFMEATGGTESTCGDYKIHTFTGPGTFCVSATASDPANNTVDYLVVAGGGGAGQHYGGGGGAGGYRESGGSNGCYPISPLGCGVAGIEVTASPYPITVGGGGNGSPGNPTTPAVGSNGSVSTFDSITSAGGGYGGGGNPSKYPGNSGGSGGGGGNTPGAAGNTPPVSPPQGTSGGNSYGGGGGATISGAQSPTYPGGGNGGTGGGTSINPSNTVGTNPDPASPIRYFAGGGGALGAPATHNGRIFGGAGYDGNENPAIANTGGGGAGDKGDGASGIVIIRYKYQ